MEPVAPFSLAIPKFKQLNDGKDIITYYQIEIYKRGAGKWSVEKRYSEFDNLDKSLKKLYGNMPILPGKSILSLKESHEIERRREQLEKYLQELIFRTDILSSEALKRFLQIENFAPETLVTPPKLMGEIGGFVLGIRDFHYQPDQGLLFVVISDMNVASRVDTVLTNLKMPWEKDLPQETLVTMGALECYLQASDLEAGIKFNKAWIKSFQTQAIVMHWDQLSNTMLLGKDDGSLTVLKVSSELNYLKYDETSTLKLHEARIMGIYFDSITEISYTASEDKRLKVYNCEKRTVAADLYCGTFELTSLIGDKDNKRIFVSNKAGQIFIFDISPAPPVLIHTIQPHAKGIIRGLYFDSLRNYLIAGNYDDGILTIVDMQKPGKEKHAHNIAKLSGKPKVRYMTWSTGRSELFTGGEDGNVTFWDAKKAAPVYALNAHNEAITKLQWLEKRGILITGGKDKKLKFYQLPTEWRDKKLEAEMHKEERIRRQTDAMIQFKRQQQRNDEDSDEDDLAGWAREVV